MNDSVVKTSHLILWLLSISLLAVIPARAASPDPDVIVKRLYAAQASGEGPFFQTESRARVDKYFTKDFADLIWNDAVRAGGEVGAIDFDPLYGSQDPDISNFEIMETGWGGDDKMGSDDKAVVQVTFKNAGQEQMISFQFQEIRGKWKITNIRYPDMDNLLLKEHLEQSSG